MAFIQWDELTALDFEDAEIEQKFLKCPVAFLVIRNPCLQLSSEDPRCYGPAIGTYIPVNLD